MKWAQAIAFELDFVIIILRSDTTNGQLGRKIFVGLCCERGYKYRKDKKDTKMPTRTRKCDSPFRLRKKNH